MLGSRYLFSPASDSRLPLKKDLATSSQIWSRFYKFLLPAPTPSKKALLPAPWSRFKVDFTGFGSHIFFIGSGFH